MNTIDDLAGLTEADLADDERLHDWLMTKFAFAGLPPARQLLVKGFACAWLAMRSNRADPLKLFLELADRLVSGDSSFIGDIPTEEAESHLSGLRGTGRLQTAKGNFHMGLTDPSAGPVEFPAGLPRRAKGE